MKQKLLYIDGEWIQAATGAHANIVDPGTGESIACVARGSPDDTSRAIQAARQAFDHGPWPHLTAIERSQRLNALARALSDEAEEIARLEALNVGKTLAEGRADVEDAIAAFDYFARVIATESGSMNDAAAHVISMTLREPVGVCGLITPWNYPILQAAWKLAPALAAGNTVVMKPASLTPLSTHRLAELIDQIDFPRGVFNLVTGGTDVGQALAASAEVDLISLTGSNAAGAAVMQAATSNFKRISLELGGKNPHIVFADANFDCALDYALNAAFFNAGQMCSAGSRLLLERSIHDSFVAALTERIARIRVGHGLSEGTQMGPVISAQQRDRVLALVAGALEEGAQLLCGGRSPKGTPFETGFWVEPTLLTGVHASMRIVREEIFGPVITVECFDGEDEAVALANDTPFGLASGLWTRDIARANRVLRRLRTATVWVNDYNVTLPHAPWGGYKASGIGRELSRAGLDEYTELKHAYINFEPKPMGWF
ncbi:aldehyde dehydrogenase family protein [Paraburkholderia silviterrae]|uniref:Aldehyde dehydrogenase family protein n=1 Tax=Paraburkholderia silviterrae TaxID=2528715 RepID=A0A4V2ZYL6_9BURK|nr:aldehyde dehydrogenase family protein [Paraburkholderia silviterrae]TDG21030.1 aldehyde dehydrogenase family protein [Paraburkholderia silviterrae]